MNLSGGDAQGQTLKSKGNVHDKFPTSLARLGLPCSVQPPEFAYSSQLSYVIVFLSSPQDRHELDFGELDHHVTHKDTVWDFKTCLAVAQVMILSQDVELQKENGLMACSLTVMQNVQALQRSVVNFQCEKKHSDELKKAQKRATSLEGKVKKKREEFTIAVEELSKRTVCDGDGNGVMVQQRWLLDALVHSQFLPLEHSRCKIGFLRLLIAILVENMALHAAFKTDVSKNTDAKGCHPLRLDNNQLITWPPPFTNSSVYCL
ncbi:hypothetical protein Acr_05g0013560 [Actinidia rufa]|uniref:Uncharacterized protein n=1 Tax=Actinidia rufa TaxID=165716 RepID=A0A7J0EQ65_9ERIC|nr:hypothetical protein Acr_05g0013560 [Actinidia rufa]